MMRTPKDQYCEMQAQGLAGHAKYNGFIDAIRTAVRNEGVMGLYKVNRSTVVCAGFAQCYMRDQ